MNGDKLMILDETIKSYKNKSEEMMNKSIKLFPSYEGIKYFQYADEYEQLAEWLEELKILREEKAKHENTLNTVQDAKSMTMKNVAAIDGIK